jgi:hypothetical protein
VDIAMKVKELIAILSKEDQDADVVLEYDSMCVTYDEFTIAKSKTKNSIYLMCEPLDEVLVCAKEWNIDYIIGH